MRRTIELHAAIVADEGLKDTSSMLTQLHKLLFIQQATERPHAGAFGADHGVSRREGNDPGLRLHLDTSGFGADKQS